MKNIYGVDLTNPASPHSVRYTMGFLGVVFLTGFSLLPSQAFAGIPQFVQGLKPDQQSLRTALAGACPIATGNLADRCQQLQALGPDQQQQAIRSLMPYQFLPQTGMPVRLWPKQVWSRSRQSSGKNRLNEIGRNTEKGGGAGDEFFRDGPLGLIFQSKFQTGSKNIPLGGFTADAYELTLGADYRVTDKLVLGSAFGYNHTETLMNQSAGNMRSDIYRAMLFGDYFLSNDVYINWLGIYTSYDNNIQRKFGYSGYIGNATSTSNADLYSVAVSIGKEFQYQEWVFGPYLRTEYLHLQVDAYREQGGQGLSYEVAAQIEESLVLIPGLQISHAFSLPWGILTPALRFEYEHQFLNDARNISLRLADAPSGTGRFFLTSAAPDRDYCNLGGSVSAAFAGGAAAFLHYESRLGQSHLNNHIVEVGFRLPF